jgi:ABC-2 type transport system ATP-binding protein
MTNTGGQMIETRGLAKTFKARGKTVEAVRGVDITVRAGEIFGLLGPNGAGKTTTMRMLSTLLPPSGGAARVAGCDLLREPGKVRTRIGYVSQTGGAANLATGEENLLVQARLYGLGAKLARQRTRELIAALELESFVGRLAKTYSGGQRRRLDVAMGLVHQPALLFLDEPTTGLDPQSRARLWEEVRKLRGLGTTIFLTTHYLDEADALCDRLAIMDSGQIAAEGTPDELKSRISGDIITLGVETTSAAYPRAREALAAQPFIREALHPRGERGGRRPATGRGARRGGVARDHAAAGWGGAAHPYGDARPPIARRCLSAADGPLAARVGVISKRRTFTCWHFSATCGCSWS